MNDFTNLAIDFASLSFDLRRSVLCDFVYNWNILTNRQKFDVVSYLLDDIDLKSINKELCDEE